MIRRRSNLSDVRRRQFLGIAESLAGGHMEWFAAQHGIGRFGNQSQPHPRSWYDNPDQIHASFNGEIVRPTTILFGDLAAEAETLNRAERRRALERQNDIGKPVP